jgi:hypothetical protein
VGFFADNARVASGAPEGFDKASLDEVTRDLKHLERQQGLPGEGPQRGARAQRHLGVVYARLPGEAWDLGAGYAVGRKAFAHGRARSISMTKADATDKAKVTKSTRVQRHRRRGAAR